VRVSRELPQILSGRGSNLGSRYFGSGWNARFLLRDEMGRGSHGGRQGQKGATRTCRGAGVRLNFEQGTGKE